MQELSDFLGQLSGMFDNAGRAMVAIGTLVGVILAGVAVRARKEPPPAGSADALVLAIGSLKQAMAAQGGNYSENMRLFEEVNGLIGDLIEQIKEQGRTLNLMKEYLSVLRDEAIRGKR